MSIFEKGKQIREGKAKILFETNQAHRIIQFFKDDATAFNALKKGTIVNKGILNNQISSWLFTHLETKGVPTHFVERISEREMMVKEVEIIPVEVVIRNKAAGSICKRLGIERGVNWSEKPLLEFFYKSDALGDPPICIQHIMHFNWASDEELSQMMKYAHLVNHELVKVFKQIGIELVDFKLEFGREVESGKVILADEITPDGSRLWDLSTGESMDKDRFRHDLGKVEESYQEIFNRLKKVFEGPK